MKNFRIVLLVFFLIPLFGALYWQDASPVASALLAVTDTPAPPPSDTPTVPPPPTDTATPPLVVSLTPDSQVTPTNTPPSSSSSPEATPVETPSVIPALGNGPRLSSVLLYGTMLLALLGVVSAGWFKVWQAYRQQKL